MVSMVMRMYNHVVQVLPRLPTCVAVPCGAGVTMS